MRICADALSLPCRLLLPIIAVLVVGCTNNAPFREMGPTVCGQNACDQTYLEDHADYDLAFVEFTERGNVFSRDRMTDVVNHVTRLANSDEGVLAVVYVHGWKHNADPENSNVESFRNLLRKTAALPRRSSRHLMGIYVGWRGLSLEVPVIMNLSYWDRKDVAHQVGKGGVTELLLRLENAVIDDNDPNRNLFLVTAHSFGSVIVLSALNEIMLERIIDAPLESETGVKDPEQGCVVSRPFGHGVALINPAIEANEILQLKEAVAEQKFCSSQDRLMHIISSDADEATNTAFRVGQWFGVNLGWRQTELERNLNGKALTFEESALDTITVGNYPPYRTGRLVERATDPDETAVDEGPWKYLTCVGGNECVADREEENHIPPKNNEPLAFIQTSRAFIKDHNTVFTDAVAGYLAAIISEARSKRLRRAATDQDDYLPPRCQSHEFNFGECFRNYQLAFEGKPPANLTN